MRRLALTFASVVLIFAGMGTASPAAAAANCDGSNWTGTCSVSNQGDHVEVGGSTTPSRGDSPGSSGASNPGSATPAPRVTPTCSPIVGCRGDYSVGTFPEVTLADLASFHPAAPTFASEPEGGVGLVGMPTNLVASATVQSIPGTVLGYPVTVRFTPVSFLFSHGDGSVAESPSGGATWAALGQPQFTPTPTSHAYAARGTYAVGATVRYSAAVDFGSGAGRPVTGVVEVAGSTTSLRIVEAQTGLVERDCLENPNGPAC